MGGGNEALKLTWTASRRPLFQTRRPRVVVVQITLSLTTPSRLEIFRQ